MLEKETGFIVCKYEKKIVHVWSFFGVVTTQSIVLVKVSQIVTEFKKTFS